MLMVYIFRCNERQIFKIKTQKFELETVDFIKKKSYIQRMLNISSYV